MSLTFSLVCDETRQKVWVGQGHHHDNTPVMETIYLDDPTTVAQLTRLLNQTLGKPLRLVVNDYSENEPTYEYTTP